MTGSDYPEPVSQLLTLGEPLDADWPDYLAMGIGPEQIPDLIRIVEDNKLHNADDESLEVWAPVHAWRALGQLGAGAAVGPLLGLLWRIDEYHDDWIGEELPPVLGMIGPAAVSGLADYVLASTEGLWARVAAAHALAEAGQRHPEIRDDCVAALIRALEGFPTHDPTLNGFLISFLADLDAVEAAPLMEKAFDVGRVDISIVGDWEDVQIELGLLEERLTPAPQYVWLPELPASEPRPRIQTTSSQQWKQEREAQRRQQEKRKARRRRQKKARKKQRKRK
jgi:hypothetical protein